jgi:hypothetical protein
LAFGLAGRTFGWGFWLCSGPQASCTPEALKCKTAVHGLPRAADCNQPP